MTGDLRGLSGDFRPGIRIVADVIIQFDPHAFSHVVLLSFLRCRWTRGVSLSDMF